MSFDGEDLGFRELSPSKAASEVVGQEPGEAWSLPGVPGAVPPGPCPRRRPRRRRPPLVTGG
ncbi:MAG: hypothetical protein R3F30_03135 [Planctomycetota bacterium]